MPRMKKGTPSGDRAAQKWHDTMLARLGSEEAIREHYRIIGRKGGLKGHTGGFASEEVGADGLTGPERAKIAGARGGRKSKRTGVRNGEGKTHKRDKDMEFIDEILEG